MPIVPLDIPQGELTDFWNTRVLPLCERTAEGCLLPKREDGSVRDRIRFLFKDSNGESNQKRRLYLTSALWCTIGVT